MDFLKGNRIVLVCVVAFVAVIFLLIVNAIFSKNSLLENLFSFRADSEEVIDVRRDTSQSADISDVVQNKSSVFLAPSKTDVQKVHISIPISLFFREIMVGDEKSARNEFVTLCNNGKGVAPLSMVILKKRTSSGKEETFISGEWGLDEIQADACITAKNEDASFSDINSVVAWKKSHVLAYTKNTLLVMTKSGKVLDEVYWENIPKGKSIIRTSPTSSWAIKE